MHLDEGIWLLSETNIIGPEPLKAQHYESLIEMLDAVFRADSKQSMREDFPYYLRPDNFPNLCICRDGDRVVSHVGFLPVKLSCFGSLLRVGMIGAVATDEDYRGKGLATRTLQFALQRFKDAGGVFLMISGGRGLYQRIGARSVGTFHQFCLAPSEQKKNDLSVDKIGPDQARILSELQQQKPYRFIRPLEEWQMRMRKNRCQGHISAFWLVRNNEKPSAYFVLPENPGSDDDICPLREWGGEPEGVIAGLSRVADTLGCKGVRWRLYPHETRARGALMAAGAEFEGAVQTQGSIRIVNFVRLISSLSDYFAEKIGEITTDALRANSSGETFKLELADEKLEINGWDNLAECLFNEDAATIAALDAGPLKNALNELLPLPCPQYNFSYT